MKKFLGLGLLAIAFASCSDDDAGSTIDMNQLTKKWYTSTYSVGGVAMPDDNEPCGKDNIEFLAEGILKAVEVYDCNGNTPVTDSYTGTYTVNGHEVTLTLDGDSTTATVTELTATTLKVTYKEDFNEDGNLVDIVETYTSTP